MFTKDKEVRSAAKKLGLLSVAILAFALMQGCGSSQDESGHGPAIPPGVGPGAQDDGSVVRGVAIVTITNTQETQLTKLFGLLMPSAYAATGSMVVTYVNAASVSFTINTAAFLAGSFTGTTLSLGHVDLASLDDNSLKVCNPGGNTKCTQGIIRVYTTGTTAGFVHTVDGYGAPVYTGSLNPSTALGLNTAGAVQVQNVAIAGNKNRLRLSDFPTPDYAVTSDFSNAGSGSYSMTYVVEYALAP